MEPLPITPEGFEKLKKELYQLKHVDKMQNIKDIETAREHGDLSENAEYQYAKEKQGMIAGHIKNLEDMVVRAQIIDPKTLSGDKVVFGATVLIYDMDEDEEITYSIVGAPEADSKEGKISVSSPIAQALIGHRQGDEVTLQTPGGERNLEIIEVRFV